MSTGVSRRRPLSVVLAFLLFAGSAGPFAGQAAAAAPTFAYEVSGPRDFVAQTNFVQCVGASMQMMLNMVRPRDDRTAATQLQLQEIARELSGQRPDGRERQGASVRGWTAGLNLLGAGPYRLVGTATLDEALQVAARAIRETRHPVGLLVWRGRHAWVMSGFEATGDPLLGAPFEVTGAVILDPLYPHGSKVWGPSPKPRATLTPATVGKQFVPRGRWGSPPGEPTPTAPPASDPSAANGGVTAAWGGLSGKYVLVLPYIAIPAPPATGLVAR